MLSWVTMSVIGGRLLLKVSVPAADHHWICTPDDRLYIDVDVRNANSAVLALCGTRRNRHGTRVYDVDAADRGATGCREKAIRCCGSLNQFSRAIGGAFGVAIMGVALTIGLGYQLHKIADLPGSSMTHEQAEAFAENPNALIEPTAKSELSPETLITLQNAMAAAVHPVFWVGSVVSLLAVFASLLLPKRKAGEQDCPEEPCGEKMIMAEQTMINARNQPAVD